MVMADGVLQGEGFSVSYSSREVTAWGGLVLLRQMLDSLGFRQVAAGWGLPEPGSNRGYAPLQLIEQFIVSIWCGACRFAHAETVRMDNTLVRLFGWTKAAGHKAIMRLFGRFDMLTNERVQAEVYRWFFGKIKALKQITLDVDSTVIARFGAQEGAARGYNPPPAWTGQPSPAPGLRCRSADGGQLLAALRQCAQCQQSAAVSRIDPAPSGRQGRGPAACRQRLLRRGHPDCFGRQAHSLHRCRPG
jgi:hypothetical protein